MAKKKEPAIKELLQKTTNARKLNEKVIDSIKQYLKIGVPIDKICKLINVNKGTFYNWKKQGEIDKKNGINSLEFDLFNSLIELQNFAYAFHLKNVTKLASEGNLQASIFFLKTRHPEDFSENPELRKKKKTKENKTAIKDVDEFNLNDINP